jgi:hypothetical protein
VILLGGDLKNATAAAAVARIAGGAKSVSASPAIKSAKSVPARDKRVHGLVPLC